MKKGKHILSLFIRVFIAIFLLMNVIAFFHAYKFTHFAESDIVKTHSPEKLSALQKIKALLFGIDNPRPINKTTPQIAFEKVLLQSNRKIACWYLPNSRKNGDAAKGTVIIFHGYSGEKSSMLDKAAVFDSIGYNCFLVDFMGSGESQGNVTTVGFKEAEQVKTAFDYLDKKEAGNIYLFGTSMGAAAIMKAICDYDLKPKAILIECPFGSMYETVCARFRNIHAPVFPMAGLLVFWGGVQNGFWAFGHNPADYAKKISCPALLMYGNRDKNVSRDETRTLFAHLRGKKTLKIFELAGHENYLSGKYKLDWIEAVTGFLSEN